MEGGLLGVPVKRDEVSEWLKSEPRWHSRLGDGWVGKRFLGAGAFGIVGLWEYEGTKANAPEVKQVVVKMVSENQDWDSRPPNQRWGPPQTGLTEAITLENLARANLTHVIRQYGGPKVGDRFNEGMGRVVKQFLEFCPGGNLEQLTGKFLEEDKTPEPRKAMYSEADIWIIFHCLALGVTGMRLRTESPVDPEWQLVDQEDELCHFDIKPDNLLFGFRDDKHRRLPIAKIADFGEACMVPGVNSQTDEFGGQYTWRGDGDMQAPEQTIGHDSDKVNKFKKYPISHPRKGTCSNIFQIGCVMNCLLLGQKINFHPADPALRILKRSYLNDRLNGNWHHARNLDTNEITQHYSRNLRELVMECLIREPTLRPSAHELVERCEAGRDAAFKATFGILGAPSGSPSSLLRLPVVMKPPEPPEAWTNDLGRFGDFSPDSQASTPSLPTSSLSSFGSFLRSSPGTPTPVRAVANVGLGLYGSAKKAAAKIADIAAAARGSTAESGIEDDDFIRLDENGKII